MYLLAVLELFELTRSGPHPNSPITSGKCKLCKTVIRVCKSSLTGIRHHAQNHRSNRKTREPRLKARILASLLAEGMPFSWGNFESIQILFKRAGFGEVSRFAATKSFEKTAEELRILLTSDLENLRATHGRRLQFSLTCDEASFQRRQYLGITLHSSEMIPCIGSKNVELLLLGLQDGCNSSEYLMACLLTGLRQFKLNVKDIAGITTDAASSMVKLGKLLQKTRTFLKHLVELA